MTWVNPLWSILKCPRVSNRSLVSLVIWIFKAAIKLQKILKLLLLHPPYGKPLLSKYWRIRVAPWVSSSRQIHLILWHKLFYFISYGEWRGLTVSVEDCHSKGRGFESPPRRFLLKNVSFGMAERRGPRTCNTRRSGTTARAFRSGAATRKEKEGSKTAR